jgi:hypothetical protein
MDAAFRRVSSIIGKTITVLSGMYEARKEVIAYTIAIAYRVSPSSYSDIANKLLIKITCVCVCVCVCEIGRAHV